MKKVDCKYVKNVKVISGEFQHNLVIVDVDKKQNKKTEWKPEGKKQNAAKLRDEPYRQLFESRVKEIMSDNNQDIWASVKGVAKTCDEVSGCKKN